MLGRIIEIKKGNTVKKISLKNGMEMEKFGESFALSLHGGEVLALEGNLGAGKTTLTKGIAKGLGIDPRTVTSPTFVLMNVYPVTQALAITQLCHVDTYRLNSPQELINIGIREYLSDPCTVTIIEWPELALAFLPPDTIYIRITFSDNEERAPVVIRRTA